MIVVDDEHYRWFLLEENGQLYLDAVCSHSAVDYLCLVRLTDEEVALFHKKGRAYLDHLAGQIHYSAPGVRGSKSSWKARSLVMTPERERADVAVDAWQRSKPDYRPPSAPRST